jgi:hypothetical protein
MRWRVPDDAQGEGAGRARPVSRPLDSRAAVFNEVLFRVDEEEELWFNDRFETQPRTAVIGLFR